MEVFAGMLDEADILKEEIPDPAKLAWGKLHDAFFANNPCKVAYGGGTLTASDVCLCLSYLEDLKQYVSGPLGHSVRITVRTMSFLFHVSVVLLMTQLNAFDSTVL